jgi:hypothetical protein
VPTFVATEQECAMVTPQEGDERGFIEPRQRSHWT